MRSRVIIIFALCAVAVASPIIRIKTINGQKKSYCCYGVVQPFDITAKAKQGLRALNQLGFNLRKLPKLLDMQQKAVAGKLENAEKEAEDLTNRVGKAVKAAVNILSDATKKATKTLSEVTEVSNDLGRLGKDIEVTKTHDMIAKIREMIAEKPDTGNKAKDKKSNDKKSDRAKITKTTKLKTAKKDQAKSKKTDHKLLKPKDRSGIPWAHEVDEKEEAQRLLANAEMYQNEQVKRVRDAIERKTQENKQAIAKTKDFLMRVENGLLQVQNGIKEAGIEIN